MNGRRAYEGPGAPVRADRLRGTDVWVRWGAAVLCLACACRSESGDVSQTQPSASRPVVSRAVDDPYVALRALTHRHFTSGIYYKPSEAARADAAFALAPLIVQEVEAEAAEAPACAYIGTVGREAGGETVVEPGRATVYAGRGVVHAKGKEHAQAVYVWAYPPCAEGEPAAWRGVRITLGNDGMPMVWEVLGEGGGARVFYASEALEAAAQAAFGEPLPDRRYAVEPSLADHGDVVVARVLADGPMAMGPWVYLDAAERRVSTLLCRCMPSQVDGFVEELTYDLQPVEAARASMPAWLAADLEDCASLEALRLP